MPRLHPPAWKARQLTDVKELAMVSQSVELEVLKNNFSHIYEAITHSLDVAVWLYQEGVVSKEFVGEMAVSTRLFSENNVTIMRAVEAAVGAEPKKLWVLMSVLERFSESAPLTDRMRDVLISRGLEGM